MQKFRKKPVVIEAVQWDGTAEACHPIIQWINGTDGNTASYREEQPEQRSTNGEVARAAEPAQIRIRTLEGTMAATPGDWIIQGVKGEYYPCKDQVFQATYEAVGE